MGISLGIGSVKLGTGSPQSWSSYWNQLISATVEDAAPTHVVLTFPSAKNLVASDITIAGFTVLSGSWAGSVYTLMLSTSVIYSDSLTVVYKGKSYPVTNNVTTSQVLDLMEYTTDNIAQTAYVTNDTGIASWVEKAGQLAAESQLRGLSVLNGELYGGTVATGLLYKWNGADAWVQMAPQLGLEFINSMCVFNGKIYGGTASLAKLYEWNGTNAWVKVADRLGLQTYINDLCVFNGKLYGVTDGAVDVPLLLEWNGTNAWISKGSLTLLNSLSSLCVFNGKLYAGGGDGILYEWNGVDTLTAKTTQIVSESPISMCVYNNKLYAGTLSLGKLLEWNGVDAWSIVAGQSGSETHIMKMVVFNNKLWGCSWTNGQLLVWNGTNAWSVVSNKLGDQIIVLSLAVFNNKLYGGTYNKGKLYEWSYNAITSSESTIKTQGSYSLKGYGAITASLNKTFTRTLSVNLDLSGCNKITFDIRATRTGSNIKIGIHDSGGTTSEITPNITSANAFQSVTWDLSGVSDANKDAIDRIVITIVNADAANTFYVDNMLYWLSKAQLKIVADIVAVSGQSNAIGYFPKDILPDSYKGYQNKIYIYFNPITGDAFQSMNPDINCGYNWFVTPNDNTGWASEQSFSHNLLAANSNDILVVKSGEQGQRIDQWDAGMPYYTQLQGALIKALNNQSLYAYKSFNVKGLLWMQGESDASADATTAYYEAKMRSIISRLRASDSRLVNLKVVMLKMSDLQTAYMTPTQRGRINTAFQNIAADTPNTYYLDTDSISGIAVYVGAPPSGDNLHYTAASQLLIGTAFKNLINP